MYPEASAVNSQSISVLQLKPSVNIVLLVSVRISRAVCASYTSTILLAVVNVNSPIVCSVIFTPSNSVIIFPLM
jgi:hypothetical protein